jgi:hypothetical protein
MTLILIRFIPIFRRNEFFAGFFETRISTPLEARSESQILKIFTFFDDSNPPTLTIGDAQSIKTIGVQI